MRIADVTERILFYTGFHDEVNVEALTGIPAWADVFDSVAVLLPRDVKISTELKITVRTMVDSGLTVYWGRHLWYFPWGHNQRHNKPFSSDWYTALMARTAAEAKMLGAQRTFCDFEMGETGKTDIAKGYTPQREDIYEYSWPTKWRIARAIGKALVQGQGKGNSLHDGVQQFDLIYPDHGTNSYGKTWKRLGKGKVLSPGCYKRKGGEHPQGEQMWSTWVTLDPQKYTVPPLTVTETVELDLPSDTLWWSCYISTRFVETVRNLVRALRG